jgi:Xaa-Pro aminopeptidase
MTPFITNIASGVNCAIFERISTDKVIKEGEMVIIDLGCVWRGYTGDLGRTVCVGEPSKIRKDIYKADYLALQEAIKAVKPGVTCGEIDAIARRVIKEQGYEKYEHKFQTGHQLGYGLHGEPAINRNVDFVLKPGMVMAIEPRITIFDKPEIGGVHLEDAVLVTETGYEKLSKNMYDEALLG